MLARLHSITASVESYAAVLTSSAARICLLPQPSLAIGRDVASIRSACLCADVHVCIRHEHLMCCLIGQKVFCFSTATVLWSNSLLMRLQHKLKVDKTDHTSDRKPSAISVRNTGKGGSL